MLAGHFPKPGRIELIEVPEPHWTTAGEGEILFQPEVACLCGSDLPYFNGEPPEFPGEIGHSLHEMVGTVLATTGQRFQPGDKVLAVPVNQQGLFERYVLSEQRAIPLDPRLAPDYAILAQPLGTVLFALKKIPFLLDKDVAIVGQGPIGQMFCAAFRNLGAREIIAIDRLESRLAVSSKMGATRTLCSATTDPVSMVQEITHGRMADIVVEAVGHADQAFNSCVALCRQAGELLFFGVPPTTVDGIAWRELFTRNVTVYTSVGPDFTRDFPLAMRWLAEGRVDLHPLITHRYPLAEIQTAFETFRDRRDGALKVLLDFPSQPAPAKIQPGVPSS